MWRTPSRRPRWAGAAGGVSAPWLALLVAIAAVFPALALPGLPATHAAGDSPFLLQRVHQMAAALIAGHFPPRWMPDAAYGLGYPFWSFYSPLAYLVAGALVVLGGNSYVGAIKVTWLLCFAGAGAGAYRLGRTTWGGTGAGLLASAAYTFAPYHMVNVYVRGDALAELAAYALLPWVLVAVDRVVDRPTAGAVAKLATALALLLVSHNVSALLGTPLILAYAIWRLAIWRSGSPPAGRAGAAARPGELGPPAGWDGSGDPTRLATAAGAAGPAEPRPAGHRRPPPAIAARDAVPPSRGWLRPPALALRAALVIEHRLWARQPRGRRRAAVGLGLGLALGGLLAAWFVLPAAFLERDVVQLEHNLTGYFHYANHFRGRDLVDLRPWFDYAVDDVTGAPTRMGLAQLVLALLGAAVALRGPRPARGAADGPDRRAGAPPIAASSPAWRLPEMFWLAVAVVTTVMITPLSRPLWDHVPLLPFAQFPWRWLGVQALALALLAGPLARLGGATARGALMGGMAVLAGVAALAAAAMAALPLETLAVDNVTRADLTAFEVFTGNIGSTVRAEYLPAAAAPRPMSSVDAALGHDGGPRVIEGSGAIESATLISRDAARQEWQVRLRGEDRAVVAFPTLWFPGWTAAVDDGPPRPTEALAGSGWLTMVLEPGACAGQCIIHLALGRSDARALAEALSLVAGLVLLGLLVLDRRWRWGRMAASALVSGLLLVLLTRAMPVGVIRGPVTLDTLRAPYPHANPAGIRFGAARLVNARLTPRTGSGNIEDLNAATERQLDAGDTLMVNLNWSRAPASLRVKASLVSPAEPVFGVPDVVESAEQAASATESLELAVPEDVPNGLYFIRLDVAQDGEPVAPRSTSGRDLGVVYLNPVRVRARPAGVPPGPEIAGIMGDITLQAMTAEAVEVDHRDWLAVRMTWRTDKPLAVDYMTSVRLLDARGEPVRDADGQPIQEDKPPRYGFVPTTAWKAGEPVADRRWLALPANLAERGDYIVQVVVYDGGSMKELGSAQVTGVTAGR